MSLTPNGIVVVDGSPSSGKQPMKDTGITLVDQVFISSTGFIGVGSGATQQDSEVFGTDGDALIDGKLGIGAAPISDLHIKASNPQMTWYDDLEGTGNRVMQAQNRLQALRFNSRSDSNGAGDVANILVLHRDGQVMIGTDSLVDAERFRVTGGGVNFDSLPTSDPTNAGELWNNGGVVNISAG